MVTYNIACIPGDGIGPEVIAEGRKVLDAVSEAEGFEVNWVDYNFGAERYLREGTLVSEEELKELSNFKAIYFGAVGDPRVRPGILERGIILKLRWYFDQYVNLRPVRLLNGVSSALGSKTPAHINFVCVKENAEDMYSGLGSSVVRSAKASMVMSRSKYQVKFDVDASMIGGDESFAYELGVITRLGAERVIKYAFNYAQNNGLRRVASVDKANVMTNIYSIWRDAFESTAKMYPQIQTEELYVDAAAMLFVREPERFQVVVLPNLFGDILTDLGAAIQGGMGLAPSANINPEGTSMFEPIHGSAPPLAGKKVANPIAAILAGGMMLDHLGRREAYNSVARAVERVLVDGRVRTPDLGGSSTTSEVGDAVVKELLSRV
ncbi:3-isopropylmalate dehydrogenase [Candidatus Marsarchaeota G2 archaeon ECH_B_2]|uniref:3-isopropylmalate dehydrogenase n=3 Tax=Candidatus Marsarchaeota group 2 TaxID=2203771 RepID=A0A2R6BCY8_9ARCH|nr:MAG: 3-isopropylmalate dehydrogenase [Candidatus Marsarchaeota G2 archaeon ECH_B_2]PSO00968.1 MAG: 3-isopropylmalate dehydrogenase [Candidatus Marsarchaeota G2 archaeon ECH_B_3]PSO02885.1 MAG: 3-isopropylmalate dehydrogenase [Candidatus Marsarchaeota G2 archaeon ECH_B_1]